MIAFLSLCYAGFIWLVFFKIKLLPWNRATQVTSITVGVVAILLLVILMNLFQPYCPQATLTQRTVPMVPNVNGQVLTVNVEPHQPLDKGDVIFTIDPSRYQAEVDRLEASLAEAEQAVPQLKAAWEAAVAAARH